MTDKFEGCCCKENTAQYFVHIEAKEKKNELHNFFY